MPTTAATPDDNTPGDVTPPILLTVLAAAQQLSISRSTLYQLLKTNEITSIKIGSLRRISTEALHAYTARKAAEYRAA